MVAAAGRNPVNDPSPRGGRQVNWKQRFERHRPGRSETTDISTMFVRPTMLADSILPVSDTRTSLSTMMSWLAKNNTRTYPDNSAASAKLTIGGIFLEGASAFVTPIRVGAATSSAMWSFAQNVGKASCQRNRIGRSSAKESQGYRVRRHSRKHSGLEKEKRYEERSKNIGWFRFYVGCGLWHLSVADSDIDLCKGQTEATALRLPGNDRASQRNGVPARVLWIRLRVQLPIPRLGSVSDSFNARRGLVLHRTPFFLSPSSTG